MLSLLTPWRAVGVDASPCFTGVLGAYLVDTKTSSSLGTNSLYELLPILSVSELQAVKSEPWVQRTDTTSVYCPVIRLARAQSSVLREQTEDWLWLLSLPRSLCQPGRLKDLSCHPSAHRDVDFEEKSTTYLAPPSS